MKQTKDPVMKYWIKDIGMCCKRLTLPTTVKTTPKIKTLFINIGNE